VGIGRTLALSTAVLLTAAAPAGAVPSNNIGVDTTLISRSLTGGLPNGPSSRPAISLDGRFATLLAFQSSATDLVPRSTGGGSNVFFVQRAQPFDDTGSPWAGGAIQLASRGRRGKPANGPSTLPAVGGDNKHGPACIAFISAASNLVPGDTNRKPDAFAFFPASQKTVRVSVNAKSKQANGAATEVVVNGACTKFAFTDTATNLAAGTTRHLKQIFLRDLDKKRTTLISARKGHAGNAASSEPAIAMFTGDIAFASKATNLGAQSGGFSQVYGVGPRLGALHLLSGIPGNGDSDQPALSQSAKGYAFRTRAPDLGSPGPTQVVYARAGVPLTTAGPPATRDEDEPTVGNQGHYVVFRDGPQVDLWTDVANSLVLLSRDSQQNPLTLPAVDPVTSEATNYAAFATSDPFADRDFAAAQPGWNDDPQGTYQRAQVDPTFHQIYLRYFGGAQ
jgi:hypothetical protein